MSRFQRAVPVLQVRDVERSMGWYVDTFGFQPDPFPEQPPTALLSSGVTTLKLCCSALMRRRRLKAVTVGPYICARPVRISWNSQRLSGGLAPSFEGLNACSMASSSLRLSTRMATIFA